MLRLIGLVLLAFGLASPSMAQSSMSIGNLITGAPAATVPFGTGDKLLIIQGSAERSTTPRQLQTGTATNDNAAAGQIGEYISSVVASTAVSMTAGTVIDFATITLTPGDWDVSGEAWIVGTGTTATAAAINSGSAVLPGNPGDGTAFSQGSVAGGNKFVFTLGPVRASLATAKTYYLMGLQFAGTGITGGGKISARRVR